MSQTAVKKSWRKPHPTQLIHIVPTPRQHRKLEESWTRDQQLHFLWSLTITRILTYYWCFFRFTQLPVNRFRNQEILLFFYILVNCAFLVNGHITEPPGKWVKEIFVNKLDTPPPHLAKSLGVGFVTFFHCHSNHRFCLHVMLIFL